MNAERLKPFFTYYGGKWRIAKHYPRPIEKTVCEPFAGSAGYALHYPEHDVRLFDKYPVIVGVWDYLIRASASEIMRLPVDVESVDALNISQEAKWLIGFWLNKGASQPCKTPSRWMRDKIRPNSFWGEAIRFRIASQVDKIRHWKVSESDYSKIELEKATWFIDPPYHAGGKLYRFGNIDYAHLGSWCQSRIGQIIVCENEGATWLDFEKFRDIKTSPSNRGNGKGVEVAYFRRGES